jgi:predicted dehydrogenase
MSGPDGQWLRIHGDAGSIELPGDSFCIDGTPSELLLTRGDGPVERHSFPAVRTYQLMIEAVAAAVRGEHAFLVDEEHSMAVARTMDAVRAATR